MEEKKKRKRRAYLDSFQKDSNGKYVYQGDFYTFEAQGAKLRKEIAQLWVICVIMAAALIAAGCVNGPGTGNCFYVLMPYVINVIAGGSVCWGLGRLTINGSPMRSYIYEETVLRIPVRALFLAVCAGMAVLGELVYIVRNGTNGKIIGCVLFLILEGLILALAVLLKKKVSGMNWKKL